MFRDKIIPSGVPNHIITSEEETALLFPDDCNTRKCSDICESCTAWVIYNENLDYLHCDDLSWQNLDSSRWSIEFNVGEHPDTESVMLHIRGGEPKEVFAVLMADLNTRLINCSTGRFISLDKPTGFKRWKAYRDKIVNGR